MRRYVKKTENKKEERKRGNETERREETGRRGNQWRRRKRKDQNR